MQTKSPKSSAEKPETRGSSVSVIKGKKKEIVIELSSNLDTNKKHHTKPAPLKKRKVKFATEKQPVYDFFGPNLPSTTKLTALRCLDFLESKDIYAVSQVMHMGVSITILFRIKYEIYSELVLVLIIFKPPAYGGL